MTGIRAKMTTAASDPNRLASTFVFDFNPGDKDSASADFGPCDDLAAEIGKSRVRTVAYVHQRLTGHAVLPALSCQELVVGPKAVVGEVVAPGEPALGARRGNAYAELVGQARPNQLAIVRKMFDADVELRRGQKDGAPFYVDLRDRAKFAAQGVTVADNAPLSVAPAGRVALLSAGALRELGVAQGRVESRAELVQAYGVEAGIGGDLGASSGKTPVGFRYTLRGPVDASTRESVGRILTDAARNKATVVILQLECAGGDPQAARELAEKLIELQQGTDAIKVVAFIPDKAPDTAAIVALGCSEIVMSLRKDAPQSQGADDPAEFESTIGGFDTAAGKQLSSPSPEFWISSLRELAEKQGHPPLIVEGLINPALGIVQAHKKGDPRAKRFVTDEEFDKDAALGADATLVRVKNVKAKGQLLVLSASKAEEYGLAKATVPNRDQTELYSRYGLTALADARRHPGVARSPGELHSDADGDCAARSDRLHRPVSGDQGSRHDDPRHHRGLVLHPGVLGQHAVQRGRSRSSPGCCSCSDSCYCCSKCSCCPASAFPASSASCSWWVGLGLATVWVRGRAAADHECGVRAARHQDGPVPRRVRRGRLLLDSARALPAQLAGGQPHGLGRARRQRPLGTPRRGGGGEPARRGRRDGDGAAARRHGALRRRLR